MRSNERQVFTGDITPKRSMFGVQHSTEPFSLSAAFGVWLMSRLTSSSRVNRDGLLAGVASSVPASPLETRANRADPPTTAREPRTTGPARQTPNVERLP